MGRLGLQFSCSQMWSYRTPKHLAISRSRMRIKMRCSSSCKCSCGLTGFVKELQLVLFQVHLKELWGIAVILNSLIPYSCISSSNIPQWCKNLSCTNTYLTSKFSKSANIISILEPSCLHMLYHEWPCSNGKVYWEPAPGSSSWPVYFCRNQKGRKSP